MATAAPKMAQPQVLDIEQAVTSWAWKLFMEEAPRKHRQLREKEKKKKSKYVDLIIDWSSVRFQDETTWSQLTEQPFPKEAEDSDKNENKNKLKADSVMSHSALLFNTCFTNNTEEDQSYTLKTEKTTCSTWSTEMESCMTKGVEMGITLKSPGEILEANTGYKREISLTNVYGETFEEELHWGVESEIKVRKGHIAEAYLKVTEKKYAGEFQVNSKISGEVSVKFINLRDNNSTLLVTSHEITDIVNDYIATKKKQNVNYPFVTVTDDLVEIITKGSCKFRYGIKQEVVVNQTPIPLKSKGDHKAS